MKPSPEIEAIVRRYLAAREVGDYEVMNRLWSQSPNLVVVGTDEHEWILGPEQVKVAEAHWREWPAEQVEILRLYAFEEGNTGWAVTEQRRTNVSGGTGVFRHTLIFKLEAGAWEVVHSHLSAPVPNLDTAGVELTRSLSVLLESVTDDLAAAGRVSGTSTLLFTDVVDSTALARVMGDQAWSQTITAHLETVKNVVESEGGVVVKTLGDGGMYAFDSGSSALRAAVRIQRAVVEASDSAFALRVGVHTGDVVRTGDDYLGSAVAKSARVASAAQGGQIMVSSTTAGMVSPADFQFEPPVMVELKGLEGTHQLHPLNWSYQDT